MIQSLYLAGPDIFRPDAVAHGERLKVLCARYGFEGLFPLDAQVAGHATGDPRETAQWIYRADLGLLEAADAVLANSISFVARSRTAGPASKSAMPSRAASPSTATCRRTEAWPSASVGAVPGTWANVPVSMRKAGKWKSSACR
jgi:Nucleoside 2-deoxyribosyltransferase